MKRKFRLQSRWPKWSKWRNVTPSPHGERHQFDKYGLFWDSWEGAQAAKIAFESVNAGEFRITEGGPDFLSEALSDSDTYKP